MLEMTDRQVGGPYPSRRMVMEDEVSAIFKSRHDGDGTIDLDELRVYVSRRGFRRPKRIGPSRLDATATSLSFEEWRAGLEKEGEAITPAGDGRRATRCGRRVRLRARGAGRVRAPGPRAGRRR